MNEMTSVRRSVRGQVGAGFGKFWPDFFSRQIVIEPDPEPTVVEAKPEPVVTEPEPEPVIIEADPATTEQEKPAILPQPMASLTRRAASALLANDNRARQKASRRANVSRLRLQRLRA